MAPPSIAALAGFGALVSGAAAYGARYTPDRPTTRAWYAALEKPPFNPPKAVFPPVWTLLYGLIAVSGWRVWHRAPSTRRSAALALWGAQLVTNAAWSKLFFGAKRPRAALADVAGLLALIGAYAAVAREVDEPAAWLMAPYGAWVAFATLLNEEIVRRNG